MLSTAKQPKNEPQTRAFPGWLILFLAFAVLYSLTANRGAQWQDSGVHIWRIVSGELINPRGLALSHPLHYYLGRLAIVPGIFEPALAITLISAVAAAIAVANTYGCVLSLTGRASAGLFAAVSLGFAHTFWQLATITETHTVGVALLSGEMWALLRFTKSGQARFALLMALLNGLGIANHMLSALTAPVVLLVGVFGVSRRTLTFKQFIAGIALWIVGTLPYTVLVARQWMSSGDLSATLTSALFGKEFARAVLNIAPSARNSLVTAGFVLLNFPNFLLPLALVGVVGLWQSRHNRLGHRCLLAALLIHVVFAARYDIVDQYTFFLPSYLLLSIIGGAGFAYVCTSRRIRRARMWSRLAVILLLLTPVLYVFAPAAARRFAILGDVQRHKPYRDDYTYLLTPWSIAETSADRMSYHALEIAPKHSLIIVEDRMAVPAVRYMRYMRKRPDVTIMDPNELKQLPTEASNYDTFVLVPRDRGFPGVAASVGQWKRSGDLYFTSR